MSNIFRKQGVNIGGGGSGSANIQEIDYATFDQKSQAEKDNGTLWLIPDVPVMPNGRTATPNDVQTWLACANITDKAYTTVSQVLADTTTLTSLINDNNASDYMARSTTWATTICANETAMTLIGANNYCADAVLADSTWLEAVAYSTYCYSVLNVNVPAMTSDTTPSGEVISSGIYNQDYPAWKAFNRSTGFWASSNGNAGAYIGYKFTESQIVKAMYLDHANASNCFHTIYVQGSNDGTAWNNVQQFSNIAVDNNFLILTDPSSYMYWRIYAVDASGGLNFAVQTLQFYGREDV